MTIKTPITMEECTASVAHLVEGNTYYEAVLVWLLNLDLGRPIGTKSGGGPRIERNDVNSFVKRFCTETGLFRYFKQGKDSHLGSLLLTHRGWTPADIRLCLEQGYARAKGFRDINIKAQPVEPPPRNEPFEIESAVGRVQDALITYRAEIAGLCSVAPEEVRIIVNLGGPEIRV